MSHVLDGIRVLEVANWVAVPSACAIMADLGAEVIKVEPPGTGDAARNALGLDRLLHDPRFASHAARAENRQELIPLLDEAFASAPRHEWAPLLDQAGCIWAPVQTTDELGGDPQVLANGYLAELSHAEHRRFQVLNPPMRLSRTPGAVQGAAPELGEHTEEVCCSTSATPGRRSRR